MRLFLSISQTLVTWPWKQFFHKLYITPQCSGYKTRIFTLRQVLLSLLIYTSTTKRSWACGGRALDNVRWGYFRNLCRVEKHVETYFQISKILKSWNSLTSEFLRARDHELLHSRRPFYWLVITNYIHHTLRMPLLLPYLYNTITIHITMRRAHGPLIRLSAQEMRARAKTEKVFDWIGCGWEWVGCDQTTRPHPNPTLKRLLRGYARE